MSEYVLRPRPCLLILALAGALVAPAAQAQERSFTETVRRSGFIFIGTVEAVGKATPSIAARPDSTVVRVDRVLEALPPVGDPTGQRVTVRLREPEGARAGEQAAFFTYVTAAGETLELTEVDQAPPDAEALSKRIAEARHELADRALSARLEKARAVVLAVVLETAPTEEAARPDSEHDPLWWRARIALRQVLKGRLEGQEERVHFATNFDYLWALAPRLEKGEEAILLLQPDPDPEDRVSGYFLLDPLDKLAPGELDRVHRLLENPR